jgi:hypothetical protein
MDDATNNLNNIGKKVVDKNFLISMSGEEIEMLKALSQNPHPFYQDNDEMVAFSKALFELTSKLLK